MHASKPFRYRLGGCGVDTMSELTPWAVHRKTAMTNTTREIDDGLDRLSNAENWAGVAGLKDLERVLFECRQKIIAAKRNNL